MEAVQWNVLIIRICEFGSVERWYSFLNQQEIDQTLSDLEIAECEENAERLFSEIFIQEEKQPWLRIITNYLKDEWSAVLIVIMVLTVIWLWLPVLKFKGF